MNPLNIHIMKPQLPNDFKGRKTLPSVGLSDPGFVYRNALNTDLRETFRKAREQMEKCA